MKITTENKSSETLNTALVAHPHSPQFFLQQETFLYPFEFRHPPIPHVWSHLALPKP